MSGSSTEPSTRGLQDFYNICKRRKLFVPDGDPDIRLHNVLLETSSSFVFCSHHGLNDVLDNVAPDVIEFPVIDFSICEIGSEGYVGSIKSPLSMLKPWLYRDVMVTFTEAYQARLLKCRSFDASSTDSRILRYMRQMAKCLREVETCLPTLEWTERRHLSQWAEADSHGAKWDIVEGHRNAIKIIVCIQQHQDNLESDDIITFSIYVDEDTRTIVQLPADIAEAAYMFAVDPDHYIAPQKPQEDVLKGPFKPRLGNSFQKLVRLLVKERIRGKFRNDEVVAESTLERNTLRVNPEQSSSFSFESIPAHDNLQESQAPKLSPPKRKGRERFKSFVKDLQLERNVENNYSNNRSSLRRNYSRCCSRDGCTTVLQSNVLFLCCKSSIC